MDEQGFQALTEQLYAAVFDDAAWVSLLSALRQKFNASVVTTMAWDQVDVAPWLVAVAGGDADADRRYTEYYHAHDLWRHAFKYTGKALQQPLIITDEALVPREIYLNSEMYHGFSRQIDVGRGLYAQTDLSENLSAGFSIHRPANMPEFDRRDIGLLTKLAPHLKRGLHLYRQMSALRVEAGLFRNAFETLGLAVFLLGESGRVMELNQAARQLLDRPENLRALALDHGYLTATYAGAATALLNMVNRRNQPMPPAEFTLYGPLPAAALKLAITPLQGMPAAGDLSHSPHVRYLVTAAPLRPPLATAEQLREHYDLTRTEAEVARFLAQGFTPTQISARRGKSLNTIKAQIKQIYAKTGVTSQTALLAKILSGAD